MGQFEHVKFSQSICVLGRCGCLLGVVIVLSSKSNGFLVVSLWSEILVIFIV